MPGTKESAKLSPNLQKPGIDNLEPRVQVHSWSDCLDAQPNHLGGNLPGRAQSLILPCALLHEITVVQGTRCKA